MWKAFLLVCIIGSMMSISCKRLPDVQGEGSPLLQGIWNQDSITNQDRLLNYTQHKFKFSCDSFYVDLTTHSKANYYADSCFNNGVWREYAKGIYELRNDSLFLLGTFTKANYRQKVSGCYQIGQYIKSFRVLKADSADIVLESTDNQRRIELKLTEPMICVPKAL